MSETTIKIWNINEVFAEKPVCNKKGAFMGPYFEMRKDDTRKFNTHIFTENVTNRVPDDVVVMGSKYPEEKTCKPTSKS